MWNLPFIKILDKIKFYILISQNLQTKHNNNIMAEANIQSDWRSSEPTEDTEIYRTSRLEYIWIFSSKYFK